MTSCKVLPVGYAPRGTLNLAKNKRALIGLTLAILPLFALSGWLFLRLALLVRSDQATRDTLTGVVTRLPDHGLAVTVTPPWLLAFAVALLLLPLLHEAVHGAAFWFITRERPTFAYKVLYAYAAAPGWYIGRTPYVIVALVALTLGGLALLPVIPAGLVPALVGFLTFNAAGAVGDLAVVGWLAVRSATTLVRDEGDAITLYSPALPHSPACTSVA